MVGRAAGSSICQTEADQERTASETKGGDENGGGSLSQEGIGIGKVKTSESECVCECVLRDGMGLEGK